MLSDMYCWKLARGWGESDNPKCLGPVGHPDFEDAAKRERDRDGGYLFKAACVHCLRCMAVAATKRAHP